MELKEKLELVTIYDGYVWIGETNINEEYTDRAITHGDSSSCILADYDNSWDWQIPVWSKALKEAHAILDNAPESESYDRYEMTMTLGNLQNNHYKATDNNSPSGGFEALVELIQFIKTHNH